MFFSLRQGKTPTISAVSHVFAMKYNSELQSNILKASEATRRSLSVSGTYLETSQSVGRILNGQIKYKVILHLYLSKAPKVMYR